MKTCPVCGRRYPPHRCGWRSICGPKGKSDSLRICDVCWERLNMDYEEYVKLKEEETEE